MPALGSRPYFLVFDCPRCGEIWGETRWLGFLGPPSDEDIAKEIGDCPTCDEEAFDPTGTAIEVED